MGQEKNKIIILIIIIAILSILCILFATNTISFKSNNNTNITNQTTNSSINSFLISDKLISTSESISSNTPDGYVFLSNGKFAYYNYNFATGYTEEGTTKFNRLISSIGTWSIKDNKLILKTEKEEYAVGGKEVDDLPYPYLSDYTQELKDTNKTIEYTIIELDNNNIPQALSLSSNNEEINWYSLSIGEELNIPKELAENGYSNTYYQLTK